MIISIKPKLLNEPMIVIVETKNSVGEIIGTVIWKNWKFDEAPSTSAASYKVFGTDWIAPNKIKKVNPRFIQTVVIITAHIALVGLVNQFITGKLNQLLMSAKKPVEGLKMKSQKIAATATETPIVTE